MHQPDQCLRPDTQDDPCRGRHQKFGRRWATAAARNCGRPCHREVGRLATVIYSTISDERGHGVPEIARMTGLSAEYVYAVVRLIEKGEERLLRSVESGQIPFSVAVEIADAVDFH
ncbi:hypothetical protein [Rhizobium sp. AP16]|uniref:hypothetical protein n=1 Tax=Rhizobium sp. AP16 TaxID=1144306 RepID=UPI00026ED82E|nr:hypothetical protein [Rhizobium sp. AP16]EJK83064.1 hypothetical protein PMI03_03310 [Rhizobium sp. AP16]